MNIILNEEDDNYKSKRITDLKNSCKKLNEKIFDFKSEISDDLEDEAAEIFGYKDITRSIERSLIRRFLVGGVEACKWLCSESHEMYANVEEDLVNLSFKFKNIVCLKWAFDNNLKYDPDLLYDAFRYADLKIAKFLIENKYITDQENDIYIGFAIENGNLDVVKYLMSKGFFLKEHTDWYFQSSYDNGHFDCFKYAYEQVGYKSDVTIYIYHTEKERLDMKRHYYAISKVYKCITNGTDIRDEEEYDEDL